MSPAVAAAERRALEERRARQRAYRRHILCLSSTAGAFVDTEVLAAADTESVAAVATTTGTPQRGRRSSVRSSKRKRRPSCRRQQLEEAAKPKAEPEPEAETAGMDGEVDDTIMADAEETEVEPGPAVEAGGEAEADATAALTGWESVNMGPYMPLIPSSMLTDCSLTDPASWASHGLPPPPHAPGCEVRAQNRFPWLHTNVPRGEVTHEALHAFHASKAAGTEADNAGGTGEGGQGDMVESSMPLNTAHADAMARLNGVPYIPNSVVYLRHPLGPRKQPYCHRPQSRRYGVPVGLLGQREALFCRLRRAVHVEARRRGLDHATVRRATAQIDAYEGVKDSDSDGEVTVRGRGVGTGEVVYCQYGV